MTRTKISPSTSPSEKSEDMSPKMGHDHHQQPHKNKSKNSSPSASSPSLSHKSLHTPHPVAPDGRRRRRSSASTTNSSRSVPVPSSHGKTRSRSISQSSLKNASHNQQKTSSPPKPIDSSVTKPAKPSLKIPDAASLNSTRSTIRMSSAHIRENHTDSLSDNPILSQAQVVRPEGIDPSIVLNPGQFVSDDIDLESHTASLHQGDSDASAPNSARQTPVIESNTLKHTARLLDKQGLTAPPQSAVTKVSHIVDISERRSSIHRSREPVSSYGPLHPSSLPTAHDRRVSATSINLNSTLNQTTASLNQNPKRFSFQPRTSFIGTPTGYPVMMHPRACESRTSASILASLVLPPSPSQRHLALTGYDGEGEFDPSAPVDLTLLETGESVHFRLMSSHESPFPRPKQHTISPGEYGSLTVLGYGAAITRLAPHSSAPPVVTYKPSQRLRLCRRDHPNGLFFTPPRYMSPMQRFYQTTLRNHPAFRLLYRVTHCTAETPDAVKQITIKALPISEVGSQTGTNPQDIFSKGQEYSSQGEIPAASAVSRRQSFLASVVPPPVDVGVQTDSLKGGDSLPRPVREPSLDYSISSRATSQFNTVPPIKVGGAPSGAGTVGPSSPTNASSMGDDGYLVYSSIPDFNYDQFQFGKSRGPDIDFVIPGYTVIRSTKPDAWNPLIDGTEPSSGNCTLSHIDTICQEDVLISQRDRYPFRIVCHRSNPSWVYLFAGALDEEGSLVCDSDTLRWSDSRVPGGIDAFPSGSGVLLWKPESISSRNPNGLWTEVSVMGNVFMLRPDTQTRGDSIEAYFEQESIKLDDTSPPNMLTNGSMIYACGMTFLWTSTTTSSKSSMTAYPNHPTMNAVFRAEVDETTHVNINQEKSANDEQTNGRKNDIVCPVSRSNLPERYMAHSLRFDRISVPQWLYDQLPWLKWSRLPNPLLQSEMCEKRPWVFQECGHVFSRYDPRIPIKGHVGTCSICHTFGPFVPLIIRPVPELIHGTPDTMLVPCGHVMDHAQANFWFRVALVPRPPSNPELAELDSLVGPTPVATHVEPTNLTLPRRSASRPQSSISAYQGIVPRVSDMVAPSVATLGRTNGGKSSFSIRRLSANFSQFTGQHQNNLAERGRPPSFIGATTLGRSTPALTMDNPYQSRSRLSVISNGAGLLTTPLVRINNPLFYPSCPFCRKEILNVKRLIFSSYEEIPASSMNHHFSSTNPTTTTFDISQSTQDTHPHSHSSTTLDIPSESHVSVESAHRGQQPQESRASHQQQRRRSSSVKTRSRSNSRETSVIHFSEEIFVDDSNTPEHSAKDSSPPGKTRSRRSSSVSTSTGSTSTSPSSNKSRRRSSSQHSSSRKSSNAGIHPIPVAILTAPTSAAMPVPVQVRQSVDAVHTLSRSQPNRANMGISHDPPFRRSPSFFSLGGGSTSPRYSSLSDMRRISSADMTYIPHVESIASVTNNLPF